MSAHHQRDSKPHRQSLYWGQHSFTRTSFHAHLAETGLVEILTHISKNTAVEQLGIEFTEVGDDYLVGRVPVDHRTHQPFGLLHGGVSAVLAETLGSCGAGFAIPEGYNAVGLDINANHLKGVKTGWVTRHGASGTHGPHHPCVAD